MKLPDITPGPWIKLLNLPTVQSSENPFHAPRISFRIYGGHTDTGERVSKEELEATATAISALPELLEALAAEEAWRNATDSTTYENLRIVANTKRQAALIKAGATP